MEIAEYVNDFTCPKCGKGKILSVVRLGFGVVDDEVLYYKCSYCKSKFSLSELLG